MKKFFIAVLLFGTVILFVFGFALIPGADTLIYGDDIHHQYYFYREFFNSFLKQGIFPWWNPYNFSGTPFIANPIVNIWYLPTWLFVVLPINVAYSWHLAFHIILAMTGMYWLMRRWADDIPAWLSGVVFGLSGFFVARLWAGHVDVIAAASWMPWVIGTSLRYQTSGLRKDAVLAAGVFAMQLYSGYQTMAFFTVEAIGLITFIHCYFTKSIRPLSRVTLVGIIGLGLAGLQIIPEQEFFRRSIRTFNFSYSWISYGSLSIENLKQLIHPFYFGDQLTYHGGLPNYAEHALFIGIIPLILGLAGIIFSFPSIAFLIILLFGLWMSIGKYAPIDLQYILWKILPMYHYLRIPPRHLILFVIGVSALAALGLNRFKQRAIRLIVVIIVLFELIPFAKHFISLKNLPDSTIDPYLVQTLTKEKEQYRLLQNFGVWIPPRESLDFDSTMAYRIFSATGYDPSILRNYYEFIDVTSGRSAGESIMNQDVQVPFFDSNDTSINFLNIKYFLVPTAYDPLGGQSTNQFTLLREDIKRSYRLYENKSALPRFYFVPNITLFPDRASLVNALENLKNDFTKTIYAVNDHQGQTNCSGQEQGTVTLLSYSPNRIDLDVSAPCNGFLSTSEVYYPGWHALIDGKEVSIFESNLAFRAIFLPAGPHEITFFYYPKIFILGAIVTLISIGVMIILLRKR